MWLPIRDHWGFQEPINGVSGQALMGLWWRVQCSVPVFCNWKYSNKHTSMYLIQVLLDITVHMHLYKEVGVEEEKSRMQNIGMGDGMGLKQSISEAINSVQVDLEFGL